MTALDTLVTGRPDLQPAADLLRALLGGMSEIQVALPPGVPSADAARSRMDGGVFALEGEPLLGATELLVASRTIAQRLADIGVGAGALSVVPVIERMLSGPDRELFTSGALAGAWSDIGDVVAAAPDVDEQTLITLLDYACRPSLRAAALVVRSVIGDGAWGRGSCPGCGAPPLMAELRAPSSGGERERFLRCGRCSSAWAYPRVGCPGCGTTDHRVLRYVHVDGEEEFRRAMTCDGCHGYVKEVAVLDPLSPDGLLEEDLATVGLDLIVVERGYRRAGVE